jgi:hypothetical protein
MGGLRSVLFVSLLLSNVPVDLALWDVAKDDVEMLGSIGGILSSSSSSAIAWSIFSLLRNFGGDFARSSMLFTSWLDNTLARASVALSL